MRLLAVVPLLLIAAFAARCATGRAQQPAPAQSPLFAAGWNLVSGARGTVLHADAPLSTIDARSGAVASLAGDAPIEAGVGYWAYFAAPSRPPARPAVEDALSVLLPAGRWSLIGGVGAGDSIVTGVDALLIYTSTTGQFLPSAVIPPDEGALVYSAAGGTATIRAANTATAGRSYPWHTGITATVFWVGEPADADTNNITNAVSAWDDHWTAHYGGTDDPAQRNGYDPAGFTPGQNPFYLDLPYNDFTDQGVRRADVTSVPWYGDSSWAANASVMKNRWVRVRHNGRTCYGQLEDAGPRYYDDVAYVFGSARPRNRDYANGTGIDVSPALRDCLGFAGLDNADNLVDWQFIDTSALPGGPWTAIVTSSGIDWTP